MAEIDSIGEDQTVEICGERVAEWKLQGGYFENLVDHIAYRNPQKLQEGSCGRGIL